MALYAETPNAIGKSHECISTHRSFLDSVLVDNFFDAFLQGK